MKRSTFKAWLILTGIALGLFLLFFAAAFLLGKGWLLGGGKVALVTIDGVILDSKEIIEQLEKHRVNPSVKVLVVRINSPGGGVAPSQEVYEELGKIREAGKPVVASMGAVAASGGYYIASASDLIVANPGSITGSIGVIMQIPNISDLLQKVGIKAVVIKSGEHKDLTSTFRKLTGDERRILQGVLDDAHDQFIDAVAKGRRMDRKKVEPLADGRIFSGRQALALGLVDELGDLQDAIERAAKLGGIPGKPKVIQERRRRFSLLDLFVQALGLAHSVSPARPSFGVSLDYLLYYSFLR